MKKLICAVLLITSLFAVVSCGSNQTKIAILKYGNHTSLNEINDSILQSLQEEGYTSDNTKFLLYDCQFDDLVTSTSIQAIKSQNVDLVIAIATPAAVAAKLAFKDEVPLIFAAVSDPIEAGLVESIASPNCNVTGTSDSIDVNAILDKAVLIDPDLKKLGFIYNPAEANSTSNLTKVQNYCNSNDITLEVRTITKAAEMTTVASVVASMVDAIFVSDDNTVASAMSVLASACKTNKIPCYTGVESMVRDGGMLCVGINYNILGEYTAKMAIDYLKNGIALKDQSVKVFKDNLNIYVNETYAQSINLNLPSSITNDPLYIGINS